eukprot:3769609-Amphidinium_carterae.1
MQYSYCVLPLDLSCRTPVRLVNGVRLMGLRAEAGRLNADGRLRHHCRTFLLWCHTTPSTHPQPTAAPIGKQHARGFSARLAGLHGHPTPADGAPACRCGTPAASAEE